MFEKTKNVAMYTIAGYVFVQSARGWYEMGRDVREFIQDRKAAKQK